MCPQPFSPSFQNIIAHENATSQWVLVGVCVAWIVGLYLVRRKSKSRDERRQDAFWMSLVFTLVILGTFLVLDVVNPWDDALTSWYIAALSGAQCSPQSLNATYAAQSHILNYMTWIGFGIEIGGPLASALIQRQWIKRGVRTRAS